MQTPILRTVFPTLLVAVLFPLAAWTQDSFEYRQHKEFLESVRFDSAVCLWSMLDDNTRLAYYNQSVQDTSKVINNFETLKAQCLQKIDEHQKNLDKLENEEKTLDSKAKMKSLVIVGSHEKQQHSELYDVTGPFGATYSRPLYNKELLQHREELYNINEGKQKSQSGLNREQSKIRASAALSAEAAEESSNEAEYILALQEVAQGDTKSAMRFRTLEKVESSVVPFDKTLTIVFNGPGRILVNCAGRFKVKVSTEGSGKVTGIGDAIPSYRRFLIVDAKTEEKYSVKVHAEAPISIVAEELR